MEGGPTQELRAPEPDLTQAKVCPMAQAGNDVTTSKHRRMSATAILHHLCNAAFDARPVEGRSEYAISFVVDPHTMHALLQYDANGDGDISEDDYGEDDDPD